VGSSPTPQWHKCKSAILHLALLSCLQVESPFLAQFSELRIQSKRTRVLFIDGKRVQICQTRLLCDPTSSSPPRLYQEAAISGSHRTPEHLKRPRNLLSNPVLWLRRRQFVRGPRPVIRFGVVSEELRGRRCCS